MQLTQEVETMLKKMSAIAIASLLALTISACSKQEQAKQEQAPPAAAPQANVVLPQKGQQATVTIPPDVKGKWKAIKLTVLDKTKKTSKDFEAKIGQETPIPGTKLSIKAEDFVPSFVMQGMNVTSASNEPTNPAAKVIITEDGKEIFRGWLFQKFPSTHAFNHPEYAITLTGGVKS
jgi:hypothetical protein